MTAGHGRQPVLRLRLPLCLTRWLTRWLTLWLRAGVVALLPGACAPVWAADGPITVQDDRGRSISLARPAQRIVSLLPSLTETVCALQACNRLVGTDRFSNWPASVLALPKLGGLEDTQIERIVSLKPDLVLAALSSRVIERLESLGLTVLALEPKTLPDTQRVLQTLALALGQPGQGDVVWARIETQMLAAAARVPAALRGKKVYFEVSAAPYAAGEASFVGQTLARLGLRNVVPASMGPFPKLNPEFVVRAQPDLVMAAARNLAEMPKRPGWSAITALRQKRSCGFVEARYEVLIRPGPRLAEAADVIAACLAGLAPVGARPADQSTKPP